MSRLYTSSFHRAFGYTVASFAFMNCIFRDFANAFLPSCILDIFVTIDEVTKVREMYFIPAFFIVRWYFYSQFK